MNLKLALHRSLAFWSGLLVMGFVVWAWVDSTRMGTVLRVGGWEFTSNDSALALWHEHDGSYSRWALSRRPRPAKETKSARHAHPGGGTRITPETRVVTPGKMRMGRPGFVHFNALAENELLFLLEPGGLDPALRWHCMGLFGGYSRYAGAAPRGWILFLPYWALLLPVLTGWIGLLLWRARRLRRARAVESTVEAVV